MRSRSAARSDPTAPDRPPSACSPSCSTSAAGASVASATPTGMVHGSPPICAAPTRSAGSTSAGSTPIATGRRAGSASATVAARRATAASSPPAGRATCTSWVRSATSARPGPRSGTSPARSPNADSSSGIGRPEQPPLADQRLHRTGQRARPVRRRPRCACRPRVRRRTPAGGPPSTPLQAVLPLGPEGGQAVEHDHDPRARSCRRAIRARPAGGRARPAASGPAAPGARARAGGDHRADVGQRGQRRELARAHVEDVDVQVVGTLAGAASASTIDPQAVVVPVPRMPTSSRLPSAGTHPTGYRVCRVGVVGQGDRHRMPARRRPRPDRVRPPSARRGRPRRAAGRATAAGARAVPTGGGPRRRRRRAAGGR